MSNPDDVDSHGLLTELATYQNRRLLLWQLAADGRSFCGVRFVAREHDLQNAPVDEQVHAFVDDMLSDGEIRPEYDTMADWDALEAAHGDTADQFL
ncbi:hypothetical protein Har1130_19065 [Haloarcula sp. CBA1130]|uniref:hypothetical protein n=1 Tax=unclassified Haloarcula TaxID=2624677 RepID=UPI001244E701|nr:MULTISPECIES: hypothetical protein [unclassified Haloarcula]KAA9396235.1 hypothetical protein Har1129_17800 [Haloarcula sp. CBA1129]KAA9396381.1 hypothetical protein Har1130_19065 [Haloarcula sp. CBA1130]KAA9397555.1 hypothetical protein Har1129_04550 [Haloarcula sp. CBA1129]